MKTEISTTSLVDFHGEKAQLFTYLKMDAASQLNDRVAAMKDWEASEMLALWKAGKVNVSIALSKTY